MEGSVQSCHFLGGNEERHWRPQGSPSPCWDLSPRASEYKQECSPLDWDWAVGAFLSPGSVPCWRHFRIKLQVAGDGRLIFRNCSAHFECFWYRYIVSSLQSLPEHFSCYFILLHTENYFFEILYSVLFIIRGNGGEGFARIIEEHG
jgi:hypothetical protein